MAERSLSSDFKWQVTNLGVDRRTFCTSLSSVEIHFQSNRFFTTFVVFSTSMLFIYLCATFITRIIHNLICSDALCMRNNVQCTLYMIVLKMYYLQVPLGKLGVEKFQGGGLRFFREGLRFFFGMG